MAKGSAMGLWRGKKGSTVFYTLKNSNNGQRQAMRERVYEISNPKTSQQASQRLKMSNAVKVYNRLKSIIRRSWEGLPYGGDGHREFMKYALKMSTGYPYVPKDFPVAVPGEYKISKGSLSEITISDNSELASLIINVAVAGGSGTNFSTVGDLSTGILNNGSAAYFKEGDQLTFIVVGADSTLIPDSRYSWFYGSIILSKNDTTLLSDALPFMTDWSSNGSEALEVGINDPVFANVVAAAVIQSRLEDGDYLRSDTTMWVRPQFLTGWTSAAQLQVSRASYMSAAAYQSTDWPVQPEEEGEVTSPALYTLSGLTGDKASCNGKKVWVRKNASDELVAVYAYPAGEEIESDALVKENGQALTYEVSMNEVALKPSDVTALASLPIIRTTTVPTA